MILLVLLKVDLAVASLSAKFMRAVICFSSSSFSRSLLIVARTALVLDPSAAAVRVDRIEGEPEGVLSEVLPKLRRTFLKPPSERNTDAASASDSTSS